MGRGRGDRSPCSQAAAETGPMALKAELNMRDARHNLLDVGEDPGHAASPLIGALQASHNCRCRQYRACRGQDPACPMFGRACHPVGNAVSITRPRLRLLSGLVPASLVETAGAWRYVGPGVGSTSGLPGGDGGDGAMSVAVARAAFQQAGTSVDGFIRCARIGYGVVRGRVEPLSRPWVGVD